MHIATPLTTRRENLLSRLAQPRIWDLAVIGGGATGLGVAVDAAARGLSVVLLESHDFAKGSSSRATKLVHGGVRYLAQGNIALVREALAERATLLRNAPHLAQPLPFVMPSYRWWEAPFYGLGLKAYDALASAQGLGATEFLGHDEALRWLPNARREGLRGGVKYWDGQFDDARLAVALARTAALQGALLLNACPVIGLLHDAGKLTGLQCTDALSGRSFRVAARCVVNAAGVWVDQMRHLDADALQFPMSNMVTPSQGVHLVVDREFLSSDHAMLVPKTADGRVLFAVPWLGKTILGTTDTARNDLAREPRPFSDEVDFILGEASRYLARSPQRGDVLSAWVGLRPLVRPAGDEGEATQALSREHTVRISRSGLVSVTGGKWTTYRAMAEDVLARCVDAGLLPRDGPCRTQSLPLVGAPAAQHGPVVALSEPPGPHLYGSERDFVEDLPGRHRAIAPGLTEAMVRFAAHHEFALTVEDVLARRSRLLFLDARAALAAAPGVAQVLREVTGCDPNLSGFEALARQYASLP